MNKFSITVLGAGVMVPTKERNPAGFLVEVGDKKILLDAGHGIVRRLVDFGFDLQAIDFVFASHFHADHFSDVFPLMHARCVDDNYNNRGHKELLILGPKSAGARFKLWRKIFWPEPNELYPLKFKEGSTRLLIGQARITTFPINHVPWFGSLGIIIKFAGKKLVYTGDVGSKQNFNQLIKATQNADLLIIEAGADKPSSTHYSPEQIKALTKAANVKKVLITHVHPQQIKTVQKFCRGDKKFVLGKDGQKLLV